MSKDISVEAKDIISKSWSLGTSKQYSVYLNRWFSYCQQKDICPTDYSIIEGINFLTEIFYSDSLGYSAMNTARSALSAIMINESGLSFGNNPLVKRLLRGMFNVRPSIPKHVVTYDVDIVLCYLKSLGEAENIPFKMLTFRTVTLLCIVSAQRDQTFAAIDIRLMDVSADRIICYIGEGLKTTRPGFHQSPLVFEAFPVCNAICPVFNIQQYLTRSFTLRGPRVKLFISYTFPYHPVCISTISRWVKSTLELAGIDINVFSSHSTRAASTTKAKSLGLSLAEINKAAGWSNSRTFARFYNKIIVDSNFSNTILSEL